MRAAVVTSFGIPPEFGHIEAPIARAPEEVLVDVIASGLHPRVRSQADGSHYTSTDELPLVPGIDGVGRTPDGELRYFILPDTRVGSMAQQTVVDLRRSIPLPEDSDPVQFAAAMNPAMSSWVALRARIDFQPGQSVLVLGATGNAGQLAVQVARHLGAGRITAAGRDERRLAALAEVGADATVSLVGERDVVEEALGDAGRDVDVVLDYLWGAPTSAAIKAVARRRPDRRQPLTWVEIGSVAGSSAEIPSAVLRGVRLDLVGSGQGSVATHEIAEQLPSLASIVGTRALAVNARAVPLSDVTRAWGESTGAAERLVLTT